MLPLNQALINTLNSLGEHPDITIADRNEEGWYVITLTWPAGDTVPEKYLKLEVSLGPEIGSTLACILERRNLTYGWGERFMALLYSKIDELPLEAYLPPLEDVEINPQSDVDEYADMPALDPVG
jgi:hypothetical protein